MKISTVTVVGANGTMGRNVSGIFASFGSCKVYMVCRVLEKAVIAKEKAVLSVKADSIAKNLFPCDYSSLEECLIESDLIFDSIVEDMEAKLELNRLIAKFASAEAIICTGTSGLSIQKLSEVFDEKRKSHYFGLHMFNPPYNLNLCEIIPTLNTNRDMLDKMKKYATTVLRRTVIEVRDFPAFLGNRIGFQFINEAMQFADIYRDSGGIEYIDAILGQYTGRSMAPLLTADFVGLDVHKAIVDNLYENTNDYAHESFVLPEFVSELIEQKKLGKKTGAGLYCTTMKENGSKSFRVYDIAERQFRKKEHFNFSYKNKMISALRIGDYDNAMRILLMNNSLEAKLCVEFLLRYISYSVFLADSLTGNVRAADDVMANGYNWIPPLSVIDAFGGIQQVKSLIKERLGETFWNTLDGEKLFYNIPCSNYDYRKYLKAQQ